MVALKLFTRLLINEIELFLKKKKKNSNGGRLYLFELWSEQCVMLRDPQGSTHIYDKWWTELYKWFSIIDIFYGGYALTSFLLEFGFLLFFFFFFSSSSNHIINDISLMKKRLT